MKLSAAGLAYIRSQGLYITEKGDAYRKLLNRSPRPYQRESHIATRDRE